MAEISNYKVASSPHKVGKQTVRGIMLDVIIALLPCVLCGVIFYGLYSLMLVVICVATCLLSEQIYQKIRKKPFTTDLSAVVTGIILGLNLPPRAPWYIPVIGGVFAIVIVKMLFGGIGKNFANPAATARVFLLLAYGSMTAQFIGADVGNMILGDVSTSATYLSGGVNALQDSFWGVSGYWGYVLQLFFGVTGGSIGETCVPAILAGGVYLCVRKIIDWRIPVVYIATSALMVLACYQSASEILLQLFAGGLMFGAYVFVFPCNMGMFGAALATGFAPMLGVLLSSVHFLQRKNTFRLVRALPSFRHFGDMCALGVSSFITELSSGLVILVFNVIILRLNGDVGVAAYGVIANISLVVLSVFTGIAQGLQPVVSRYLGQGEEKNAAKAMKLALLTAAGFALSAYLFGALFANPIVNIFNRDNDAQLTQIAVHGLYLYFAGFVFAGVNIVTAVYFGGIDLPRESFAISLMRGFIFIIPAAFALSALFDMTGVWLSFPVAEILTACAAVFLLRRHRKKNRLRLS